ncbi:hypothetical protein GGQ68_003444 [Sagittula marina]|uniref:Uncharacterized protein n=1 Tax=Sagittula marina TaxID=943940 RepID=A0A7W6DQ38_9RHOB|nr:hypothetical protein [Sagittula marina]MBB3987098.1 hypothetical protein [Sagittula marina]
MRSGEILGLIWRDGVALPSDGGHRNFEALFGQILPVRTAALLAGKACPHPLAMSDELELAPALPLGDVLVEELPLDLPYGTMVLFLPEWETDMSLLLGGAVGETFQLMINLACVPMERETDALYLLAHAAVRRVAGLAARGCPVDPGAFNLGLAGCLQRHWAGSSGAQIMDPTLFAREDFLWQPSLTHYLARLDPGFTAPDPRIISADLLGVSDQPLQLPEWTSRMEAVMRAVLGAPEREPAPVHSGLAARFNLQ